MLAAHLLSHVLQVEQADRAASCKLSLVAAGKVPADGK